MTKKTKNKSPTPAAPAPRNTSPEAPTAETPGPSPSAPGPSPPSGQPASDPPANDPFLALEKDVHPDSVADNRVFKFIRSKHNNLRIALIVSPDEEIKLTTEKGQKTQEEIAAVFAVGAGFHDEPFQYPGLAHLTEHLYGRGATEKNPTTLLSEPRKAGFYINFGAYTLEDITVYHCIVPYIQGGSNLRLRRFLEPFNDNNFAAKDIKTEVDLLTEEYELYRSLASTRYEGISALFHPSGKTLRNFTWGNSLSLYQPTAENDKKYGRVVQNTEESIALTNEKANNLKNAVKEFTKNHYKIENCVLVLQYHGTIDWKKFEDLAEDVSKELEMKFSQAPKATQPPQKCDKRKGDPKTVAQIPKKKIRNGNTAQVVGSIRGENVKVSSQFVTDDFYKVYYVQPPDFVDKIYISWVIDYGKDESMYFRTKALIYISALLKCCGKTSLVDYLCQKNYLLSLDAHVAKRCVCTDKYLGNLWSHHFKAHLFTVELSLTLLGVKNLDDVISATMFYIGQLKPDKKIYDTLKALKKVRERDFGVCRSPLESAKKIACAVLYPEPYRRNILTDDVNLHDFNEEEIQRVLNILKSPKEVNLVVMAHIANTSQFGVPTPCRAADGQLLGFEFASRGILPEELEKWFISSNKKGSPKLGMPTKEQVGFLQGNVEYDKACKIMGTKQSAAGQPASKPKEINHDCEEGRYMYVRVTNPTFQSVPFANVNIKLQPPEYNVSHKLRAYMALFAEMFKFRATQKEPTRAEAECSQISFTVESTGLVTFWILGLHHMAKKWLLLLLHCLKTPKEAMTGLQQTILEATRKKFLSDIYSCRLLARDLAKRGTITSHAPLIESYNILIDETLGTNFYTEFASILGQMEVGVYVQATITEDFEDAWTALKQLVPYQNRPPPMGTEHLGGLHKVSLLTNSNSSSLFRIRSADPGSFLLCNHIIYLLPFKSEISGDVETTTVFIKSVVSHALKFYLSEEAGAVYAFAVDFDQCPDPDMMALNIQVTTDSRRYNGFNLFLGVDNVLNEMRESYIQTLTEGLLKEMGYGDAQPATLKDLWNRFLKGGAPEKKYYCVEVTGLRELAAGQKMKDGLKKLSYGDFSFQPEEEGLQWTWDADAQLRDLYSNSLSDNLPPGTSLRLVATPPRFLELAEAGQDQGQDRAQDDDQQ